MKKRMCRQMSNYCCCLMAMTMKGSVYIIIGNEQIKHRRHEKNHFSNRHIFEYQHQQHLSRR